MWYNIKGAERLPILTLIHEDHLFPSMGFQVPKNGKVVWYGLAQKARSLTFENFHFVRACGQLRPNLQTFEGWI